MAANPNLTPQQRKQRRIGRRQGMRHGYAAGAVAMASRVLRPGDVAFDLGANRGAITGPLAQSGATVKAFEPDPDCFDALTDRFGETPNVELFQQAVSDHEGQAYFFRHRDFEPDEKTSEAGTLVSGNPNVDYDADGIQIAVVDFVAILEKAVADHGHIAFIKMDIEGSEVAIMRKLMQGDLLDSVGTLLVETHEVQYPGLAEETKALKEAIAARYAPEHVYTDWI